ncbi:sigma-54 dependent transcriptional regulator [Cytophagales bacterium LB-30]|uniref:Sigma-54 dependent transcriptional regulator n=1 Tax=Shiella aurantiaca TaxID=3058365 RepID=A0ABT8F3L0_9BACT|nr:sigma-54 dependent transcriptional regulator [Shiella aurantiaca]MDN4165043.1 sigma-54 dependent transcriptional regulator [Shiella aurantiaca]
MSLTKSGKILIVDDNEDVLRAAKMFLKRHFTQIDTEKDPESIPTLLMNEQYDVILLDMNFTKDVSSGREGFYWLDRILQIDSSAVVVLITAYGDVDLAVRAIKEGATDFVIKPWENEKLLATISSAMRLRHSRSELETIKVRQQAVSESADAKFLDIIGQSPAMIKLFETINRVAATDANILILGENGTGKELVSRAIHRASLRSKEIFIGVDMGAVSETLFESELFGHTKGSFTDAKEDRAGKFEAASGGTLFLDEIGNLPMTLQAKLLTVLQNRQVTRVGSNKAKEIDIRLICATNMPVYEMVKTGKFRQDLLYRINTIEIQLPPLRERKEDIALLAEHFINSYARKYNKEIRGMSPATIKRIEKYTWPGNIRELQHSIERAVIMSNSHLLQPEDFFLTENRGGQAEASKEDVNLMLDQMHLEEVEKLLIRKVLKKYNGNITQAASELGLTRASLYRRLEKYGL